MALPKLLSENVDLKGSWESHPMLLNGKIVSLSQSFSFTDIKSFACTNIRCRNNQKIIRHVGLKDIESQDELGPSSPVKQEVFISTQIKCQNCRQEINELYPFRSTIEYKMAKIKLSNEPTIFTIDALIVGSELATKIKLSQECTLIGFPKLTVELPDTLKKVLSGGEIRCHHFEVYGVEPEGQIDDWNSYEHFLLDSLNSLTDTTCPELRFPLLLLLCQFIGAANEIHFNLAFPGIDVQILNIISNLLNTHLGSDAAFGFLKSNMIAAGNNRKSKSLEWKEEEYPYYVNIISNTLKIDTKSNKKSFVSAGKCNNQKFITVPIEISSNQEANVILNAHNSQLKYSLKYPKIKTDSLIELESQAVSRLQKYFLSLRSAGTSVPLKATLDILTKLTQISAIVKGRSCSTVEDAEFAIMIHSHLTIDDEFEADHDAGNFNLMSPSISFDSDSFSNESSSIDSLNSYYKLI